LKYMAHEYGTITVKSLVTLVCANSEIKVKTVKETYF
jgi:hypothetical protein